MNRYSELVPHSLTFLLVDDDADGRFLAERTLKKIFDGCSVLGCASPEEAVAVLGSARLDAIVTDHSLGHDSGCDFIAHVRAQGITCPVVMVTCSDDPEVSRQAYRAGATKVFTAGGEAFARFLQTQLNPSNGAP